MTLKLLHQYRMHQGDSEENWQQEEKKENAYYRH